MRVMHWKDVEDAMWVQLWVVEESMGYRWPRRTIWAVFLRRAPGRDSDHRYVV